MIIDFEAAFSQSPSPCMILNRSLEFVAANPAYLKIVDRSWENLDGRYVFDAFPESKDRIQHMTGVFLKSLGGEETTLSEIPFRIEVDGVVKEQWWTAHQARLGDKDDDDACMVQFCENVTNEKKMREMREAMLGELQHRVGNLFAMVLAIARRTASTSSEVSEFMTEFESRLGALLTANRSLMNDDGATENIADVIDRQVSAHDIGTTDRVAINGPAYPLNVIQSQAVSMAVHELAANSVKHGALGEDGGSVSITWSGTPGKGCHLIWKETGIGVASQKSKAGYGTMLLDTIIPSQLDGSATRVFEADGLIYRLEIGGDAA